LGGFSLENIYICDNKIKIFNLANCNKWCNSQEDTIEKDINLSYYVNHIHTCCINNNKNLVSTRVGDFESLIYIILKLQNIKLPWDNCKCNKKIAQYKKKFLTNIKDNEDIPLPIQDIISYIDKFDSFNKPNYTLLEKLFNYIE
jgi:hypothetical protein